MSFALIKDRSLIKISGEDSVNFLQGLVTTDVNKLSDTSYSLMLSPQGKYLFDFFIIKKEDFFLCDIDSHLAEQFIKKMQFYKLRSKVNIEKFLDANEVIVINNDNVLQEAFLSIKDPRSAKLGYRYYFVKGEFAHEYNEQAYHLLRLENMVPEACYDLVFDKSFPLEYGMEKIGAINFNKGCYVGQEVITRTHHRGVIRKSLCLIKGQFMPKKGSILLNKEGVEIGVMASSINDLGFALIKNDFLVATGEKFTILEDGNERYFLRLCQA